MCCIILYGIRRNGQSRTVEYRRIQTNTVEYSPLTLSNCTSWLTSRRAVMNSEVVTSLVL